MHVKRWWLMQSPPVIMPHHRFVVSWKITRTTQVRDRICSFLILEMTNNIISDAKLLCAADKRKDQTFFLSQMPQNALRRTMFPLGTRLKNDVKRLAIDAGLHTIARKKESMGICFVGKRSFPDFIGEYIAPRPGRFVDIETGKVYGEHKGFHHYTIGQGIHVCHRQRLYVMRKLSDGETILVAAGPDNPAFFSDILYTKAPHWIDRTPFARHSSVVKLKLRITHGHPLTECWVTRSLDGQGLLVTLCQPIRAISSGQYAVFYRNDECLGSAQIHGTGPSQLTMVQSHCVASRECDAYDDYDGSES